MSLVRYAQLGGGAAVVASAGDFLLLYVANAQRPELGLSPVGPAWLWVGAGLGVLAIPLYAAGYRAAAGLVAPASTPGAAIVSGAGAITALSGALVHGLTASHIEGLSESSASGSDPLAAVAGSGALLLTCWSVAAFFALLASAVFCWFVLRGSASAPRSLALTNPALVTLLLAGVGLPFLWLRSFLTPAAPNLAHIVFFAACGHTLATSRKLTPQRP
jgi:hypothetical protein